MAKYIHGLHMVFECMRVVKSGRARKTCGKRQALVTTFRNSPRPAGTAVISNHESASSSRCTTALLHGCMAGQ